MFGIDDAVMAAGISAGGNLLGGMLGASGQAATNAQQIQFAREAMGSQQQFNADQSYKANLFTDYMANKQMDFQSASMDKAMAFNQGEANTNREYQSGQLGRAMEFASNMSSTAWQRGVADMKAAGINPILAASLGGASSPSMGGVGGAQANITGMAGAGGGGSAGSAGMTMPQLGNVGEHMGRGIASAAQAGRFFADVKESLQRTETAKSTEEMNKQSTETSKTVAAMNEELKKRAAQETVTSAAQEAAYRASAGLSNASATNEMIRSGIYAADVTSAQENARIRTREREDVERHGSSTYGRVIAGAERTVGTIWNQFKNRNTEVPAVTNRVQNSNVPLTRQGWGYAPQSRGLIPGGI